MPSSSSRTPSFSAQLIGLDDAAFELVDRPVRVDDEPAVAGAPHLHHPDCFLDLDLSNYSGIGGEVLVLREADAAAPPGAGRRPAPPAAHLGYPLDDGAGSRIGEDRQAVGYGVLAGLGGQLIDKGFDRKHIKVAPRPRSDEVRTGVSGIRWWLIRFAAKL